MGGGLTGLFLVITGNAPLTSARAAIYPEILAGERCAVGIAVTLTTSPFAQVVGFAADGMVAGFPGTRVSRC